MMVWRLPDQRLTAMGGIPVVQGNATLTKDMDKGEKGVDCEWKFTVIKLEFKAGYL